MTTLTAERNTLEMVGDKFAVPVKANTTLYAGSLAVGDAGYAAPGRAATGLVALGRVEETVTAVEAGDAIAQIKRGTFCYANSASADLIAQANVGSDCYIVDDQTVALTSASNTRSRAGIIVAVDAAGVWVQIGLGL
jgi:hypothetical protein